MRHLLLLSWPLLFLVGCSQTPTRDRKAEIENWLPGYISPYARRHSTPTGNTQLDYDRTLCSKVELTKESEGHYTGVVHFIASNPAQIEVVDEGKNIQFRLAPEQDWGNGRVPPVD